MIQKEIFMNKTLLTLSAAGAAALLTACGGGSSAPAAAAQEASQVLIQGTAVDELILNGKVKVQKPDATLLAEGRTSTVDGTYDLNVSNYTGAVVINVTCDANSTLLVNGAQETCPSALNLNSVANADGNAVTVNISPLTEITYQRAVALGGGQVTADAVTTASNQVALMFGVDPIQNNPTEATYANIVDAFHAVAAADPSKDLFTVINEFAADLSDGVVDNSAALIQQLADANVTNPLTTSGPGGYTVPTNPASMNDVTTVKALVQAIRTQGTTLEAYGKAETEDIGTALDSVALDVQTVVDYVAGIVDLVTQAREEGNTTSSGQIEVTFDGSPVQADINISQSASNPDEWSYTAGNNYAGTITMPEIVTGMENTFTALNASFTGTLPYVENIYSQTPNVQTQNVTLDLALTKTAEGADLALTNFTITNNGSKISIDSLTGSIGYAANQVFNYVKLDAVTFSAIAGDYNATGTLSVPAYAMNTSLAARGGISEEEFTGFELSISCPNDQVSVSTATVELNGQTYAPSHTDIHYEAFYHFDDIPGALNQQDLTAAFRTDASCPSGDQPQTQIRGVWYDTEDMIGNSGHVPAKLAFIGSITNTQTNGELNGTVNVELLNAASLDLTADFNDTNAPELKVDVNGRLAMPQRPETLLNLSYETKANDDAHRHSLTGSYSYSTTLITLTGSMDKAEDNAQLTFTDGSGVTADFILANKALLNGNANAATGSLVKKDGKVVATIEERNDAIIIKYLDGSFESIF